MAIQQQNKIHSLLIKDGADWNEYPLGAEVDAVDVSVDPVYDARSDLQLAYESDVYLDEQIEASITAIANTQAQLQAVDQRITELSEGVEDTVEQRIADGVRGLDLVPSTRTIAGLDLSQDRTAAAIKTALSLSKSDVGLSNVTNSEQIPLSGSTAVTGKVGYNTGATGTKPAPADSDKVFRNIVILRANAADPSGTAYSTGTIIMKRKS